MDVVLPLLMMSSVALPPARSASAREPLLPLSFDLEHRPLPEPELVAPVDTAAAGSPLALSVLDDERQRLRLGIGPGGRARLGLSYRLTLGN